MSTLIAEDLMLLLLDDDRGTLAAEDKARPLLGGALLVELALAGRVQLAERTGRWSAAKVVSVDGPAPADPLLVGALALVDEKPRSAEDLVHRIGKGLKEKVLARLEERGLVRAVKGTTWGLFPRTTWPATDRDHESAVRARLQAVLVDGVAPDDRTAALVSLLSAVGRAHTVVDHRGLPAKQVRARAEEIAEGAWTADAVSDAVSAAQAAVTAAVITSTVATTVVAGAS